MKFRVVIEQDETASSTRRPIRAASKRAMLKVSEFKWTPDGK